MENQDPLDQWKAHFVDKSRDELIPVISSGNPAHEKVIAAKLRLAQLDLEESKRLHKRHWSATGGFWTTLILAIIGFILGWIFWRYPQSVTAQPPKPATVALPSPTPEKPPTVATPKP